MVTEAEKFIRELTSQPEYCIVSYLVDEYRSELTLFVSEYNKALLGIPEFIDGMKVTILRLVD